MSARWITPPPHPLTDGICTVIKESSLGPERMRRPTPYLCDGGSRGKPCGSGSHEGLGRRWGRCGTGTPWCACWPGHSARTPPWCTRWFLWKGPDHIYLAGSPACQATPTGTRRVCVWRVVTAYRRAQPGRWKRRKQIDNRRDGKVVKNVIARTDPCL